MIILDEQLVYKKHQDAIRQWYQGQVITINALRPNTVIKDDAIPTLLLTVQQPTFVTINVKHFWRTAPTHRRYCIVTLELLQTESYRVPVILRQLLQYDEFRTKMARMGKIIRWRAGRIDYYGTNQPIIKLDP